MRVGLNVYGEADWDRLASCHAVGTEFDWFARDRDGQMAVFTSAGHGPIPRVTWEHLHDYNALVTFIESLPRGDFIQILEGSGHYEDWQDFAAAGLFGFDYQDVHRVQKLGGYDLITRPLSPLQSGSVPADLLTWVPVLNTAFATELFVPDRVVSLGDDSYA